MPRARALALLCLASTLWGSGWIFGPELAEVAQPFAASALALGLGALLLGIAAASLWVLRGRPARARMLLRPSLLLGLLMLAGPGLLALLAGAHGIGGWPLLLYALLPLLTAFPQERWSMAMVLAAGAVFLLIDSTLSLELRTMAWALLILFAVAMQAYGLRYAARHLRGSSLPELALSTAVQAALAALLLACGSLLLDNGPRFAPWSQWGSPAILAAAYLGVSTAAAYLLLYWLLSRGPLRPEQVAAGQWLQTLCAIGESAYFARARVPWLDWLAAAALLACYVRVNAPQADTGATRIVPSDTPREKDLP